MEDTMMRPAVPEELCTCDRETFERVWRRVMADGEPRPIQTDPPADDRVRVRMGEEQQDSEQTALVVPRRMQTGGEADVVCLGRGSEQYAPLLQEMIDGKTEDMRTYQALARRAGGAGARVLGTMAADERRHAKRLSAAYFLITGERYQSHNQNGSRPPMELMTGLREQFIQEQRSASAFQGAAQETADPCLRQLYQDLSREDAAHARMIRNLLEQM